MSDSTGLVCVTGASGYIGTHVVRRLLARGYAVRATVRDPADPARVDHLRALGDVEILAGDLLRPGSFDRAVEGCTYVVHAASPVMLTAKDPDRDIVAPAVRGTRNVLESVVKAGTVERVVLTSSVAAVYDPERPDSHIFTEDDWNESATAATMPYPLSKTRAERTAHEFRAALPSSSQFELTAINPTFVLGPVDARIHLKSSPSLVRQLMAGKLPAIPDFYFNLVDVRDVAEAHVLALHQPRESLEDRYLCFAEQLHFRQICDLLRSDMPDRRFPTWTMPHALVYAYALFDKRLTWSYLRRSLGRRAQVSSARARTNLGLSFRPIADTLRDTAKSIVDLGLVR